MRKSSFRDLLVWQRGVALCETIYQLTKEFPEEEKFGLVSQMRRASVSIPSNIAEGHGRGSNPEMARFLTIAIGSSLELETQLEIAVRVGLMSANNALPAIEECQQLAKMMYSLTKAVNK